MNPMDAMLSGIPFLGEGFAQQQGQNFEAAQSAQQMAFQNAAAQKQMDFQERMSGSAHQREVSDLKAAGLNPMLSVNSGSSTPMGSAPSGSMASGKPMSGAGNSAKLLQSLVNKERHLATSNIAKIDSEKRLADQAARTSKQQQDVLHNSAKGVELDNKSKSLLMPKAKAEGEIMNMVNKGLNSAKDAINSLTPRTKINPKGHQLFETQSTKELY